MSALVEHSILSLDFEHGERDMAHRAISIGLCSRSVWPLGSNFGQVI